MNSQYFNMTTNQVLLALLPVGIIMFLYYGNKLLKSDNYFFYNNGRSMRTLDITLAGEKDTFNTRINSLTEDTIKRLRKWIFIDFLFMPGLYGTLAILCYFSSFEYSGQNWSDFFVFIIIGQGISYVADLVENTILIRSLKERKMPVSMDLFNIIVGLKLFFPILAFFVSFSTAVLAWFRFMNDQNMPTASLLFILPALLAFLVFAITRKKKTRN